MTSLLVGVSEDDEILVAENLSRAGSRFDWLFRLHSSGGQDTKFAALAITNLGGLFAFQKDAKVLVAGGFTNFAGVARNRIVRLYPDGNVDPSFDPGTGPNKAPLAIAVQPDGKILIAGAFTNFNGVAACRVARLNPNGSLDSTFDAGTGPNSQVNALALTPDGQVLVAGQFTSINGLPRNRIARLNGDDPAETSFVVCRRPLPDAPSVCLPMSRAGSR